MRGLSVYFYFLTITINILPCGGRMSDEESAPVRAVVP